MTFRCHSEYEECDLEYAEHARWVMQYGGQSLLNSSQILPSDHSLICRAYLRKHEGVRGDT